MRCQDREAWGPSRTTHPVACLAVGGQGGALRPRRRQGGESASLASVAHRDEYFRMKLQWKSVSPEQERRNSLLHGYRSLIGGWG